jgi:putative peptidoglycan lipid II flippase
VSATFSTQSRGKFTLAAIVPYYKEVHFWENGVAESKKQGRSLVNIAGIVAVATLISKLFGLVRQQAIAAAFGTGAAVGAYNFAYVIPGFLLILLGGINGPFHSAIVSVLAKRKQEDVAPIVETIMTLVVGVLLVVAIGLIVFAEPMMHLTAPGLFTSDTPINQQTREIAIRQFQIMAPMAVLAGLIGIGFGTLNAADQYWLPSISPLFSSVAVLLGIGGLALTVGNKIILPEYAMLGGMVLAWATLAGGVVQWLAQLPAQWKSGLGGLRLRFDFRRPEVQEVIKIMVPATFSSGMLQINVWTDLFFASFIPDASLAVSAMGYAGLLALTPLGILSNAVLVPLLPAFAKNAASENWGNLKDLMRQGLLLTAATMLPTSALLIALSLPMTRVVYERGAFSASDSQTTAAVLIAYAIGMFFYLGRDVLVRVFYALEDGQTPFRISVVNIFLNGLFDFLLVKPLGAPGLVLATVFVNILSLIAMLWILHRRLGGLPLLRWAIPIAGLTAASAMGGAATWATLQGLEGIWGRNGLLILLVELAIAGTVGFALFAVFTYQLKLPEVNAFSDRLRQRLRRR